MNEVTPGRYPHYKGNEYTVVGTARHSETLEDMIVYHRLQAAQSGESISRKDEGYVFKCRSRNATS